MSIFIFTMNYVGIIDKLDAYFVATILIIDNLNPYSNLSERVPHLKSLVKHRFRLIHESSKFKTLLSRHVMLVFPEA